VTVNPEHTDSDIVRTRISRVNHYEQAWITALLTSGLDTSKPFTAKQAVAAIATTPVTKGGKRHQLPNSIKLCYVMRKTKLFERSKTTTGSEKVMWRLRD
jgi:hypothetical protein